MFSKRHLKSESNDTELLLKSNQSDLLSPKERYKRILACSLASEASIKSNEITKQEISERKIEAKEIMESLRKDSAQDPLATYYILKYRAEGHYSIYFINDPQALKFQFVLFKWPKHTKSDLRKEIKKANFPDVMSLVNMGSYPKTIDRFLNNPLYDEYRALYYFYCAIHFAQEKAEMIRFILPIWKIINRSDWYLLNFMHGQVDSINTIDVNNAEMSQLVCRLYEFAKKHLSPTAVESLMASFKIPYKITTFTGVDDDGKEINDLLAMNVNKTLSLTASSNSLFKNNNNDSASRKSQKEEVDSSEDEKADLEAQLHKLKITLL